MFANGKAVVSHPRPSVIALSLRDVDGTLKKPGVVAGLGFVDCGLNEGCGRYIKPARQLSNVVYT